MHDKLQVFGTHYSRSQLSELSDFLNHRFQPAEWINDILTFLEEWFNANDFIETRTSGTTGKPKIIRLSKRAMIKSAQKTIHYLSLNENDHTLLVLPAQFIAGKMMIVRSIIGSLNLQPFPPNHFQTQIKSDIDFIALVPNQLKNYLKVPQKFRTNAKVLLGGGVLTEQHFKSIESQPEQFYQSYASTETASHVAIRKASSSNVPYNALKGIYFTSDDRGCLMIHNDYLDESPIITNDVVEIIDRTHFLWKGRIDNIINSAGLKINPEEIEQKIAHLIQCHFVITSKPSEEYGEEAILLMECHSQHFNIPELLTQIKKVVGSPYTPKDIQFVAELPRTETGKIIRGQR